MTSPLSPAPPKKSGFRVPYATLLLFLAVALPSTLQFFFPGVLAVLQRNSTLFLKGDWWRIITPLFVQDGGLSGTLFNLVSLLLVGSVAEQFWGGKRVLLIFFLGGILAEGVALAWQPVGAGNSVANFSLAASMGVRCLMRRPPRPVLVTALLALGADLALLGLHDIHGAAAAIGVLLALVLSRPGRSQDQRLE